MELFVFENYDQTYNVIAYAITEEQGEHLERFTQDTGIYGQWSTIKQQHWSGKVTVTITCAFNNVDRNTLIMLQLGLK